MFAATSTAHTQEPRLRPLVDAPPLFERLSTAFRALAILSKDTSRLDQVFALGRAVNLEAIARNVARFESDPDGVRMLSERPHINTTTIDLEAFARLPDGTLGREYARFLSTNGITPDAFRELPDLRDERAAYVIHRLRQTHDLWHVLTGYAPDVRGEILLQAFTYAQTGAPSAFAIAAFGTLRWLFRWPGQWAALKRAYRLGKTTRFLIAFPWEDYWTVPVTDVRARLACDA